MDVRALAFDPFRGRVFAGTNGDGVFRSSPVTGIGPFANPSLPNSFELSQNYPNPFNPSTTIEFTVGKLHERGSGTERVTLTIYDLLGREVRTLVNQQMPYGRHRVHWDGTNDHGQAVGSGVYTYRLQAGDPSMGSGQRYVQSRKMVLIR
jgi:hypothetical protein